MARFDGKVALITGGASGIGRATAEAMAAEGAAVIIGDVSQVRDEVAAASGGRIDAVSLDVTSDAQFAAAVDFAMTKHGRLDILFNNAGASGAQARIDEIDMDAWDSTMALLLRSVALGTRLAVPAMRKNGGGAIVNTASVAAFAAGNGPIAYSVAKAGVVHMTKVAAAELARHNIRVNAICPGLILTGIFTESYRDRAPELATEVEEYMNRTADSVQPLRRVGMPSDVADLVMFLASEQSAFITGTHMLIDGGLLVGGRHSWDPAHRRPDDHPLNKVAAKPSAEEQ